MEECAVLSILPFPEIVCGGRGQVPGDFFRRNRLHFAHARCERPVIALCRDIRSALLVALFYLVEHGERSC